MARILYGFFLSLTPAVAFAQSGNPAAASPGGMLLQTLVGLLFVLALIFALAYCLKKFNLNPMGSMGPMRVVASLNLGTREKVVLVELGDQQMLLGVAPGRVNTLHVFDQPIQLNSQTKAPLGDAALQNSEFAKKLTEMVSFGKRV